MVRVHQVPGIGGVVVGRGVGGQPVIGGGLGLARVVTSVSDIRGQLEAGGHVVRTHEGVHRGCGGHAGG